MGEFIDFFKKKKNLLNLVVLGILVLALPLGINLIRQQQILKSRAEVDPIVFTGDNVQKKADGSWIATKPQITLNITSPLGPPGGQSKPTPTPTPIPTPSPISSSDPLSCPNKLIFGINGSATDKIKQLYTRPSIRFLAISWGGIQPEANSSYNFSYADNEVNNAIADGQTPSIKFCDGDCFPDWARQMDRDVERSYCCTNDNVCRVLKEDEGTIQAFKNVVSAMVTRYKGKVSQWDYGIEPNCRGYNPQRYTNWLKYFSEAVRSADPQAVIIGGHLSDSSVDYLSGMYASGARPYFDKIAVDPYPSQPYTEPLKTSRLEGIRDLMVSQGDGNKKVWIGEWGISAGYDEGRQAELIKNGLDYMASKSWIEAAFYHNFECELWTASCSPGSPGYLGYSLQRSDGSTKPSYDVFKNAVSACQ